MTALLFDIVLAFERGKAFKDRLICSFLRNGRTYTGVISSPNPFSSFASFTAHAHAMQIETFLQHSACFGNKRLLYNSSTSVEQEEMGQPKNLWRNSFLGLFSSFLFALHLSSCCIITKPQCACCFLLSLMAWSFLPSSPCHISFFFLRYKAPSRYPRFYLSVYRKCSLCLTNASSFQILGAIALFTMR